MIGEFAIRLKQLRLDKHLRQPSYAVLVRFATLYRVSTNYLLGCSNNRTIDISGLTETEAALIMEMVASMTAKNQKLEELRE